MAHRASRHNAVDSQASQVRRPSRPTPKHSVGSISPGRFSRSSFHRGSNRDLTEEELAPWNAIDLNNTGFQAEWDPFMLENPGADLYFSGFPEDGNQDIIAEPGAIVQQTSNLEFMSGQDFVTTPKETRASMTLLQNPGVAVPSTPRPTTFHDFHQQIATPMGNQATNPIPPVWNAELGTYVEPQLVNGRYVLRPVPIDPLFTSIPKSPKNFSPREKRYGNIDPRLQSHGLVPGYGQVALYDDQFAGLSYPDPSVNDVSNGPYYGLGQPGNGNNNYLQGRPSPTVGFTKHLPSGTQRLEDNGPVSNKLLASKVSNSRFNFEPRQAECGLIVDTKAPQSPAVSVRSTASTYPTRSVSFSGTSRSSSDMRLISKTRHTNERQKAKKRQSVYQPNSKVEFGPPKKRPGVPGYRINATTVGNTTRTAKINSYEATDHYTYSEHPIGNWSSPKFEHTYTDEYSVVVETKETETTKKMWIYEFADRTMPAAKIRDFILNYPKEHSLTLWIQAGPADSKLRYQSANGMKCRFAECPTYKAHLNGTIKHGAYRVAFDERYSTDKDYDPYLACCGFVHLYCMERFLDFEYICRKARVKVDIRSSLPNEPKSRYYASLNAKDEAVIAQDFINQAQSSKAPGDDLGVRNGALPEFKDYPIHKHFEEGAEKPYENTLCFEMFKRHEKERPPAQKKQFSGGVHGLTPSKVYVHRGNLELIAKNHLRQKRRKAAHKKAGKKHIEPDPYDSASSFCEKVRYEIARAKHDLAKALRISGPRKQHKRNDEPPIQRHGVRSSAPEDEPEYDSDVESEDANYDAREWEKKYRSSGGSPVPTRRSKRIENTPQHPDYRDEPEDVHQHFLGPRKHEQDHQHVHNSREQEQDHQQRRSPRHHPQGAYQQRPIFGGYDYKDLELEFRMSRAQSRQQSRQSSLPSYNQVDLDKNSQREGVRKRKRSVQGYEQSRYEQYPSHQHGHAQYPNQQYSNQQYGNETYYNQQYYDEPENERPQKRQRSIPTQGFKRVGSLRSPTLQQRSPRGRNSLDSQAAAAEPVDDIAEFFEFPDQHGSYLNRRMSGFTDSPRSYSSIMRSSRSRAPSLTKRHASFNTQPVSHEKTFNSGAPPHNVQPRMVKELENDRGERRNSKASASPTSGRKLRSGRSLEQIPE
ncbi:hypothetical protein N0V90_011733 [Kalmusia sp. IMI 367209]|nr:hypothetical protein N0V90_011733 [Kalmusia sp. IMI 367209]